MHAAILSVGTTQISQDRYEKFLDKYNKLLDEYNRVVSIVASSTQNIFPTPTSSFGLSAQDREVLSLRI